MILEFKPIHLMIVAMDCREEDKMGFGDSELENDPQRWAARKTIAPGLRFTVADERAMPLVCIGLDEESPRIATAWLVAREGWQRYIKSIRRGWMLTWADCGYDRVQALVRNGRQPAHTFARWMGLSYEGTLRKYFPSGEDATLYAKVR